MKPSERIYHLAEEGRQFKEIAAGSWDYIRAIKQYLDEQHAKSEEHVEECEHVWGSSFGYYEFCDKCKAYRPKPYPSSEPSKRVTEQEIADIILKITNTLPTSTVWIISGTIIKLLKERE